MSQADDARHGTIVKTDCSLGCLGGKKLCVMVQADDPYVWTAVCEDCVVSAFEEHRNPKPEPDAFDFTGAG